MNDISEKNQRFIIEGLNLLSSLDDLKGCEEEIFKYLEAYSDGSIIDKTELFKVIGNAEYFKVKTNDIVGTVSLHISKVQYEQKDIQDKLDAVDKNAHIGGITLPANIITADLIPDFDITITNLGLQGVSKNGDEVYIKLHYPDLVEYSEKTIFIPKTVMGIAESIKLTVQGMKSPGRNYQYNLSVHVRDKKTKTVFGRLEIKGINISKEADSIHVVQETYQRL